MSVIISSFLLYLIPMCYEKSFSGQNPLYNLQGSFGSVSAYVSSYVLKLIYSSLRPRISIHTQSKYDVVHLMSKCFFYIS